MGPYCNFCGDRCFVPVLESDDVRARAAYMANGITIAATCPIGAHYEKAKLGVSLIALRNAALKAGGA